MGQRELTLKVNTFGVRRRQRLGMVDRTTRAPRIGASGASVGELQEAHRGAAIAVMQAVREQHADDQRAALVRMQVLFVKLVERVEGRGAKVVEVDFDDY